MDRQPTADSARLSSQTAPMVRTALLTGLAVLFLWLTIRVDLVIFAGILLAIFLGKLSETLRRWTGLPHGLALAAVVAAITLVAAAIGWSFAQAVSSQIDQLAKQLPLALAEVEHQVQGVSWLHSLINPSNVSAEMGQSSGFSSLFGIASNAVEVIAGIVVLAFVGLYTAAEPEVYRDGLLRLAPVRRRARLRQILDRSVTVLWAWMLGRIFSMSLIGICTAVGLSLIGVPVPIALGLLAGILTFVPYLGTIASAVPSLLIAFTVAPRYAVYVALLYLAIHALEGYILVPIVQRRAAHLPPALTLSAQAMLGATTGILGIIFATPLAAALVSIIRMVYVEDVLGDRGEAS